MRIALGLTVVVWGLWLLVRNIRRGLVPWRTVLLVAVPFALLGLLDNILRLRQIYEHYDTTQPLASFLASSWIGNAMSVVGGILGFGIAAAFLLSFFPDCLSAFRPAGRRYLVADAAAATLAVVGLTVASGRIELLLHVRFHAQALLDAGAPSLIESLAPAVSAFALAFEGILPVAAGLALLAVLSSRIARKWWLPIALLAATCVLSDAARTPAEVALSYAQALVTLAPAAIFCLWFGRRNYLAYALVLWIDGIHDALDDLLGNPNSVYHLQGWIVLAVTVVCIAWFLLPAVRKEPVASGAAAA